MRVRVRVRGGPENFFLFLVIIAFHKGPYGPPSRSNWTQKVQLLLKGFRTSISKETYCNLRFLGEGVLTPCTPPPSSGSAHVAETASDGSIRNSMIPVQDHMLHSGP